MMKALLPLMDIRTTVCKKSQLLLTVHVNNDSLYELDVSPVPPLSVDFYNSTLEKTSIPPVSCDMHAWITSPKVLQSHYTALGSYY